MNIAGVENLIWWVDLYILYIFFIKVEWCGFTIPS